MASPRNHTIGLRIAVTLMLICSLTLFPSKSVGSLLGLKRMKTVLGSRPPRCLNRCLSCRPCMAALVIPPHPKNGSKTSSHGDASYYLLSWRCKCGNKFFQP
ncbi:hypothetical protein CFOL_v3_25957 [Cephalotus follicularis]|uniref:Epidermal patterning factor-like protein n=1 Tax=Cephalotus follicularis TaxID=3775 RepID=A0A1Q3CQH5_CEPFO|nr:hypothetical protein CFOL_v3_25957 [Cephalotus follicularis]